MNATAEAPAWAAALAAGAPPALVARTLRLTALGRCPGTHVDRAVVHCLDAGFDVTAEEVVAVLEAQAPLLEESGDALAAQLLALGARCHVVGHPGYPSRLASAWPQLGAPLSVFVQSGDGLLPDAPAVAIVGTRRPTLDGLHTAGALARLCAQHGVVVVSGLARGIDQAAHRGALDAGGATIAVLGTGLDVDYPRGDGRLRDAIAAAGGLVSEYTPGTRPMPRNFLARNRIISGLADVTVVVEGRARSGALNTAQSAGMQGRAVLAVPGSLHAPTAQAPLQLIRDGAQALTRVGDVLEALGIDATAPASARRAHTPGLSAAAAAVLPLLGAQPASLDALARAADRPLPAVVAAIGELVLAGLVLMTPRGAVCAPARPVRGP